MPKLAKFTYVDIKHNPYPLRFLPSPPDANANTCIPKLDIVCLCILCLCCWSLLWLAWLNKRDPQTCETTQYESAAAKQRFDIKLPYHVGWTIKCNRFIQISIPCISPSQRFPWPGFLARFMQIHASLVSLNILIIVVSFTLSHQHVLFGILSLEVRCIARKQD